MSIIGVIAQEVLENAKVIFEVGAKRGDFTRQCLTVFPVAEVHAFEPAPANFQGLMVHESPRLHPVQGAILDYDGVSKFYLSQHIGSHSVLKIDQLDFSVVATIKTPVSTLDSYCEQEGISRIDLLRVDTEGTELAVLKGATRLLNRECIGVVCVKLIYYPYWEGQSVPEDIVGFLQHFGMRMIALFPNYYQGDRRYADAIFVK